MENTGAYYTSSINTSCRTPHSADTTRWSMALQTKATSSHKALLLLLYSWIFESFLYVAEHTGDKAQSTPRPREPVVPIKASPNLCKTTSR